MDLCKVGGKMEGKMKDSFELVFIIYLVDAQTTMISVEEMNETLMA